MARAADVARNAVQHAGVVALAGVRPERMVGHDVIHAIPGRLVVRPAVEAVVAAVVLDHARPFDGVPVEGRVIHVHAAVGLVERPVIAGAHDHVAVARQARHVEQAIHDDGRARMHSRRGVGEVARVEEIPLAVVIPEREGVNREAVRLAIHQLGPVST